MDRFLDPIWIQRGSDALRETLDVDHASKVAMVQFLLDEGFWNKETLKSFDAALQRFNDCLNPGKSANFKLCEVWALMKRFRRPQLLYALCEDLGFERPRERTSDERQQELLARIADNQQRLVALVEADMAELARLGQVPKLRLHPAVREGRGSFSRPDDTAADYSEGGF